MENKILNLFCLLAFFPILIMSCDDYDNSAEGSAVTYLPTMSLNGDEFSQVECNETYTDEGANATEGGSNIPVTTNISASYFGDNSLTGADLYVISYSAYNKDSIPGALFRHVLIEPCTTDEPLDIAGLYSSNVVRTSNGETYDVSDIFIVRTGTNTYALSHSIGGFYDLGRGYGSDYACKGTVITVNSASDLSASQGQFPVWGNTVDITDLVLNADGSIAFTGTGNFGNGEFKIVLTPK